MPKSAPKIEWEIRCTFLAGWSAGSRLGRAQNGSNETTRQRDCHVEGAGGRFWRLQGSSSCPPGSKRDPKKLLARAAEVAILANSTAKNG